MLMLSRIVAVAVLTLCGSLAQPVSGAGASLEILHPLEIPGKHAAGGIVADAQGNLYGMTTAGGQWNMGTVYRCSPSGEITTIYSFSRQTYSERPTGRLCLGADGWLYGLTRGYDGSFYSRLFRISKNGEYQSLERFEETGGYSEHNGIVEGQSGVFYGTLRGFGMFRYSAAEGFQKIELTTEAEGLQPNGPLALGADGRLYGVTAGGNTDANRGGTLFRFIPGGSAEVLFSFGYDRASGTYPNGHELNGALTLAADGSLYGLTGKHGPGKSFLLRVSTTGAVTIVAPFPENAYPSTGELAEGEGGWLYGMYKPERGMPGLFRMHSLTGAFEHVADSTNETAPDTPAGLTRVGDGFVGVEAVGPNQGGGRIFRYSSSAGLQIVQAFQGSHLHGSRSSFISASDGYLYAVFADGGSSGQGGVIRLDPATNQLRLWHTFPHFRIPDEFPDRIRSVIVEGAGGNLYAYSYGEHLHIDRIAPDGTGGSIYRTGFWTNPRPWLSIPQADATGGLFTIVQNEADHTFGRLEPTGTFVPLHTFTADVAPIRSPTPTYLRGIDGNFYGLAPGKGVFDPGVFFRISPQGEYQKLRELPEAQSISHLTSSADGNFYALQTPYYGGPVQVIKFSPMGDLDVLSSVSPAETKDLSAFVQARDGQFYAFRKIDEQWEVVRMTVTGRLRSVLRLGHSVGWPAAASLTLGPDGKLYGQTRSGGEKGGGVVFRIALEEVPPLTSDDLAYSRKGESVIVDVLANDEEPNNQQMVVTAVGKASRGKAKFFNGQVIYTPDSRFRGQDAFSYTITDSHGGTATGVVQIRDPLVTQAGRFETHILGPDRKLIGQLALNLTGSGHATGAITLRGVKIPFKGRFGIDGSLVVKLKKGRNVLGSVNLHLDFTSDAAVLSASVQEGVVTHSTLAVAAVAKQLPLGVTPGSYTIILNPQWDGSRQIAGWASAAVGTEAKVTIVGQMSDGQTFTVTTAIQRNGQATFYASFQGSNSATLTGSLNFHPEAGLEDRVSFSWSPTPPYPDGRIPEFSGSIERHLPPPAGAPLFTYTFPDAAHATLHFSTPSSAGGFYLALSADDAMSLRFPAPGAFTGSVDRASGRFQGSFINPATNEPIQFSGVLDQKTNSGFGYCRAGDEGGSVHLIPE